MARRSESANGETVETECKATGLVQLLARLSCKCVSLCGERREDPGADWVTVVIYSAWECVYVCAHTRVLTRHGLGASVAGIPCWEAMGTQGSATAYSYWGLSKFSDRGKTLDCFGVNSGNRKGRYFSILH